MKGRESEEGLRERCRGRGEELHQKRASIFGKREERDLSEKRLSKKASLTEKGGKRNVSPGRCRGKRVIVKKSTSLSE